MKMRLKELRVEHGYTQNEIAEKLNIKQNTYSQYESGVREIPLGSLVRLATLYDTSVDYILYVTDEELPYNKHNNS
ncbi:MAG: helix-turn-helix transcriptional regulator [Clostridia bacterium]|nr:helix-turn-helix transcriptional regulator [Clostridia bacterium]